MSDQNLKARIHFVPGMFYQLGQGHAIVKTEQQPGEYELGEKYSLVCMFEMWNLMRDGQAVGYFFLSGMKVESKGGFIVTFMESKRGRASESQVLIRCDEFVLLDFPHCGAMAISTAHNEHIKSILEGQ